MLPEVATDLLTGPAVTAHVVAPMAIFVNPTCQPNANAPETG